VGLYAKYILPRLIDLSMRQTQLAARRARLLRTVRGRVLEIGVGSGLNFPHYGLNVGELLGVDPSAELLATARRAVGVCVPVSLFQGSAENLPFRDASVDSAVVTWALCSIPDPVRALREVRRVLKPGGELRFIEHGLSPEPRIAAWQRRVTPLWRRFAGNCHLDRQMDEIVRRAGFELAELTTGYARGPRPLSFLYEGRARAP
jgi:ubiquinone/menaquinone biosynthesis C-methylase UbiE